jgi:hypothetical protein
VHGPPPQSWHWAPPLPHSPESVPGWQVVPWQHPVAHDVESQTQAPITQRSPCGQAGPVPHWQSPAAEQRSALMSHFVQAVPPIPQLARARARQTLPAQQPAAHEVASQTHLPPRHRCPAPHTAPAPQAQAPAAVHESAMVGLHDWQMLPAAPQRPKVGVARQVAPSQQPFEHEFGPHPQLPFTQRVPDGQAGPTPQVQTPVAEQLSAVVLSHSTQTAPPVPQVVIAIGLHVAPEQHPLAQVAAQPLQRPSVQDCPEGQASQAPPPVPHEVALSPDRHWPFWQHPCGQDVPSQTQVLPRQRCPRAHAVPVPHRQAPAAEQLSERASHTAQLEPASPQVASERVSHALFLQQPLGQEVASQMHNPLAQRWPPTQAGPEPHSQFPVSPQRLALVLSQARHAAPPAPQVASPDTLHSSPWQQPPGHDIASHRHAPFMQRCPLRHAGPPPQRHSPSSVQVSALERSQAEQTSPPVPQLDTDRA